MHYYYLALEFLASSLSSVLVGYPLLWLLFGRDWQGVIKPPLYWHAIGMLLVVALMVLIRFGHSALTGEVTLFREGIDDVSVMLMAVIPLVLCFLVVKRIRKMAFRRAATRSHAPFGAGRGHKEQREQEEFREPTYQEPHQAPYLDPRYGESSAGPQGNPRMGPHMTPYVHPYAGAHPASRQAPYPDPDAQPDMHTHAGPQRSADYGHAAHTSPGPWQAADEHEAFVGSLEHVEESVLLAIDEELETGNIDRATWIKAYAEADGVEHRVKARYIRLRAAKLQNGAGRSGTMPPQGSGDQPFNPERRH